MDVYGKEGWTMDVADGWDVRRCIVGSLVAVHVQSQITFYTCAHMCVCMHT